MWVQVQEIIGPSVSERTPNASASALYRPTGLLTMLAWRPWLGWPSKSTTMWMCLSPTDSCRLTSLPTCYHKSRITPLTSRCCQGRIRPPPRVERTQPVKRGTTSEPFSGEETTKVGEIHRITKSLCASAHTPDESQMMRMMKGGGDPISVSVPGFSYSKLA